MIDHLNDEFLMIYKTILPESIPAALKRNVLTFSRLSTIDRNWTKSIHRIDEFLSIKAIWDFSLKSSGATTYNTSI